MIREDVKNRNLLFSGTEFSAFTSIDGGAHWVRLASGLPTVAVAGLGTSLVSTGAPPTPDRAYHLVVGTVAGYPPVPNPPPPGEFTYEPDNDGVAVDRGQAVSVAGSTLLTQQFRVVHGQAFRPDLLAPYGTISPANVPSSAAAPPDRTPPIAGNA